VVLFLLEGNDAVEHVFGERFHVTQGFIFIGHIHIGIGL